MAHAEIKAGICGFTAVVDATLEEDGEVTVYIQSDCKAIQAMAANLTKIDPYRELSFRGSGPRTLEAARLSCKHPSCPVPSGIMKTVEVAANLALPADVEIKITR